MDTIDTVNPWGITRRPTLADTTRATFPTTCRHDVHTTNGRTIVTLYWGDDVTGVRTPHTETYVADTFHDDGTPHTLIRKCGRCEWGHRFEHANVMGGVCFHCTKGMAPDVFHGTLAEAKKGFRRRSVQRAGRERARVIDRNAHAAKRIAFLDDHPEVIDAHDRFLELVRSHVRAEPLPEQVDAVHVVWKAARRLAPHVEDLLGLYVLDEDQVKELVDGVDATVERVRTNPEKYVGGIGETLTVTGTVSTARSVRNRFGRSTLFVIDGTGPDAGVTAKFFSSARWLDDYQVGEPITFAGTVSAHEVDPYNDRKTTTFKRPTPA